MHGGDDSYVPTSMASIWDILGPNILRRPKLVSLRRRIHSVVSLALGRWVLL